MKLYEFYNERNKLFIDLEKEKTDTILTESQYSDVTSKLRKNYGKIDDLCPHTGQPLALINAKEAENK